ncbi:hypothetical protein [Corynebacterium sp. CNJ-954]|uniref:hypothetical protein n=1 Tax=Corynebacterium sp. CNJ-954 TaxID=1904962 RepID=UPI0021014D5E|nr:hypothetical protein [Corynebacterium sp. CNJ-954]
MPAEVTDRSPASTVTNDTETDGATSTTTPEPVRSPLTRLGLRGRPLAWANWFCVALGIYLLITAVSVVGSGFKAATGGQAEELFSFASNPLVAS